MSDDRQPRDGLDEFQNGCDLVGDLIAGRKTTRSLWDEAIDKVFGKREEPAKPEAAPETTTPTNVVPIGGGKRCN